MDLLKPLVLWKLKWKAEKGKKADLVQQWSSLPEQDPAPVWIEQDETELQMLQHQQLTIANTKLRKEQKRLVEMIASQMHQFSPRSLARIEQSIWETVVEQANNRQD